MDSFKINKIEYYRTNTLHNMKQITEILHNFDKISYDEIIKLYKHNIKGYLEIIDENSCKYYKYKTKEGFLNEIKEYQIEIKRIQNLKNITIDKEDEALNKIEIIKLNHLKVDSGHFTTKPNKFYKYYK